MDAADEGRWMTFIELSQARGISEASARKLVRRHKWRRQAGNQGIVRILVPLEALDSPKDSPRSALSVVSGTDLPHDLRPDPSDMQRAVSALETAVLALREQLERSETGRERAEQAILEERSRADRAEQGRDGERARADALADQMHVMEAHLAEAERVADHARAQAQEAQAAADARRQADEARRQAGVLERLRRAWRGD